MTPFEQKIKKFIFKTSSGEKFKNRRRSDCLLGGKVTFPDVIWSNLWRFHNLMCKMKKMAKGGQNMDPFSKKIFYFCQKHRDTNIFMLFSPQKGPKWPPKCYVRSFYNEKTIFSKNGQRGQNSGGGYTVFFSAYYISQK